METVKAYILNTGDSLEMLKESSYVQYSTFFIDIVLDKIDIYFENLADFNSFAIIFNALKELGGGDNKKVIIKALSVYNAIYNTDVENK